MTDFAIKMDQSFKLSELSEVCAIADKDIHAIPDLVTHHGGTAKEHWTLDRGSNILGIAHIDSIQSSGYVGLLKHPGGDRIYCPRADDRLGVYTILKLLPALGINVDVLLTNFEESGRSTAEYFEPEKEYNWIFQFDRRGDDVVLYDYYDEALVNKLKHAGFKDTNRGAFSDICKLEDMGVKGFNVGCGYHEYHTLWSYIVYQEYFWNVVRFMEFFHLFSERKLTHKKYVAPARTYREGWWEGNNALTKVTYVTKNVDPNLKTVTFQCGFCVEPLSMKFINTYYDQEICPHCKRVAIYHPNRVLNTTGARR